MTDGWLDGAEDRLLETEKEQSALAGAKGWKPDPGDTLYGTVIEGKVVNTKFGPAKIINVRETKTDEVVTVWCSRSIIKNLVNELAPKPGTGISVKYVGLQQPTGGGNAFHMYVMDVEASDFDYWSALYRTFKRRNDEEESKPTQQRTNVMDPDDPQEAPF